MTRFLPVLFVVCALGAAFLVERVVKPRADSLAGLTDGLVEPAKLQVGIAMARLGRLMAPTAAYDYDDFTPATPAGWEKRPYHSSDQALLRGDADDWGVKPDAGVLKLQRQLAQIQSRGNQQVQAFYSNGQDAVLLDVKTTKSSVFDGLGGGEDQSPGPVFTQVDGVSFHQRPAGQDGTRLLIATLGTQAEITVTAQASDDVLTALLNGFDMAGLRAAIGVLPPKETDISDTQLTMTPVATDAAPEPAAPIAAPVQNFRLSGAKATNNGGIGLGGCSSSGAGKFCKVGSN